MTKEKVFLTFLSSDNYIYFVIALHDSWKKTNSKYKFYCAITQNVSEATIDILKKLNILYVKINTEDIIAKLDTMAQCTTSTAFKKSTEKLQLFGLTKFSECLFLDADMLIEKNIDELLDKPDFASVPDDWCNLMSTALGTTDYVPGKTLFNGGLFKFTPSKKLLNTFLSDLSTLPNISDKLARLGPIADGWNDQNILAYYNQNWPETPEQVISKSYNFFVTKEYFNKYEKSDSALPIYIKHFVTSKAKVLSSSGETLDWKPYLAWIDYINLINSIIKENNLNLRLLTTDNIHYVNKPVGPKYIGKKDAYLYF